MGWGELSESDTVGTTGQIEAAHKALNKINIRSGPLAVRVMYTLAHFENVINVNDFIRDQLEELLDPPVIIRDNSQSYTDILHEELKRMYG